MEALKDYKRKQEELWLFFMVLPKRPINEGRKKDGTHFKYKTDGYDFKGVCRKEFDAICRQAQDLWLSCGVDFIDLEDEIAENTNRIDVIRKMVSDHLKWPQYDADKSPWLNSLLEAGIIDKAEHYAFCNDLKRCAETMRDNAQMMKQILDKYAEQQDDKVQEVKTYPHGLLHLFNNHTDLIDSLANKSDDDIATRLMTWSYENKIENVGNTGKPKEYADALKYAGLIKCSASTFRQSKICAEKYRRFCTQRDMQDKRH